MPRTAGALLLVLAAGLPAQWVGRPAPPWEKEFQAWVADPHRRIFPGSFGRNPVREAIRHRRESGGDQTSAERAAKEFARAVDLATQQFDRTRIPHDPIPARMDEARAIVNKLLVELNVQ